MTVQKIKTAAPMPKDKQKVVDNPMKLYSYLVCLSGLADYPENTRMFRQKNLVLTKITQTIGLDPKTTKLYLFYLEKRGLIKYRGEYQFNKELYQEDFNSSKEYRLAAQTDACTVWKLRNKQEKDGVYHIPRPMPYTPVPEITLERLNKDFEITELELKLYLICCCYRDECIHNNKDFKVLTFENIRDILGAAKHFDNDNAIRRALVFLKGVGLIEYTEGQSINSKDAMIPVFKLKEVNYYIGNYQAIDFTSEEKEDLEIIDRISNGFNKIIE